MEVSFEDCKPELLDAANAKGKAAYDEWRHLHDYEEVGQFVEGFTHRRLFELSAEDIRNVMRLTAAESLESRIAVIGRESRSVNWLHSELCI